MHNHGAGPNGDGGTPSPGGAAPCGGAAEGVSPAARAMPVGTPALLRRRCLPEGQERRSSERHRGRRPRNSQPHVTPWRRSKRRRRYAIPRWRHAMRGDRRWEFRPLRGRCRCEHRRSCAGDAHLKARSAALQSGIAATGRETPNVMPNHGAGPNVDGGTPSPGGAAPCGGAAEGVSPAARAMPVGTPALLRRRCLPEGQERRSSERHRGRRPRNSQPHVTPWRRSKRRRRYAIPRWRHAMRGDRRWEFRPLRGRCRWEHRRSCAGDAHLKARSAALQSGIAATGRETPNVMPNHGAGPNVDGGNAIPRWRRAMRGIGDGSFARCAGDAGVNTGAPAPAMPA